MMVMIRVCPQRPADSGVNDAVKPSWFIIGNKNGSLCSSQTLIRLSSCAVLVSRDLGCRKAGPWSILDVQQHVLVLWHVAGASSTLVKTIVEPLSRQYGSLGVVLAAAKLTRRT